MGAKMTAFEQYAVEIIKLILSMTFTGSIISLILFILKPLIKDKLPKSFQYYMWFSVVIALMLPVSKIIVIPISNTSVMSMKSTYDFAQWITDTASEKPVNPAAYFPSTAVILFVLWQLGMIVILGFHMICYVSYVRRLGRHNINADRQEVELLNNLLKRKNALRLYKNPIAETPILIGFFHPAVILPDKKYEDIKLQNILMHEMIHRKRHDIFVKWLLIFVGAVHWFNPLVYFVRREMNKACELACDESVIKRFDLNEMQQYGDTLIAVAADSIKKMPLPITMFEDKKNLKERLGAIMKHEKHPKRTVIAASVILVTIVCAILGFNTLHGIENEHIRYTANSSRAQNAKYIKENELGKALCNYDEMNIVKAYVFLNDSDGELINAYITIICQEKNPDSAMQSGVESFVSEELGLDVQNIYIDYIDFETFVS